MLNLFDLREHGIKRCRHGLVHQFRFMALDKVWRPAIAAQQLFQFLMADTRKHRRISNLVAI